MRLHSTCIPLKTVAYHWKTLPINFPAFEVQRKKRRRKKHTQQPNSFYCYNAGKIYLICLAEIFHGFRIKSNTNSQCIAEYMKPEWNCMRTSINSRAKKIHVIHLTHFINFTIATVATTANVVQNQNCSAQNTFEKYVFTAQSNGQSVCTREFEAKCIAFCLKRTMHTRENWRH